MHWLGPSQTQVGELDTTLEPTSSKPWEVHGGFRLSLGPWVLGHLGSRSVTRETDQFTTKIVR